MSPGPVAAALRKNLHIFSIPQLVIMNKQGKVLTKNGREDIENGQSPVPGELEESISESSSKTNSDSQSDEGEEALEEAAETPEDTPENETPEG